jgi:hypothetical protein
LNISAESDVTFNKTPFDLVFLVFNATFSNISAISWRPVLGMEEAGENHQPWTSNWQALSLETASRVHPF